MTASPGIHHASLYQYNQQAAPQQNPEAAQLPLINPSLQQQMPTPYYYNYSYPYYPYYQLGVNQNAFGNGQQPQQQQQQQPQGGPQSQPQQQQQLQLQQGNQPNPQNNFGQLMASPLHYYGQFNQRYPGYQQYPPAGNNGQPGQGQAQGSAQLPQAQPPALAEGDSLNPGQGQQPGHPIPQQPMMPGYAAYQQYGFGYQDNAQYRGGNWYS